MKICLLAARFPPDHCGIGDYTYFLGKALAQLGHKVDVLTSVGQMDPVLYPLCRNMHAHRVIKSWGLGGLWDIFQACRRLRPDVLIVQYGPHAFNAKGITVAVNLLPFLLRTMTRTRVVTNFHELYIPFAPSLRHGPVALWQRAMAFVIAYGSHRLMATASGWPERLRRIGIFKNTKVIPVGSNISRVEISLEERMRIRTQLLGERDGLLLAGFGALRDRDMESVMVALQGVKAERPATLVWLGAGGEDLINRERLEVQIKARGLEKNWVWTGLLPSPEISKFLGACDVMVLPFKSGISTRRGSAVAALQHGLSLLSTYVGQVDPCFMHGRNLYLVPLGNREALVQGLLDLARSPDLRARLAQGGLALHGEYFSWDMIARQVLHAAVEKQVRKHSSYRLPLTTLFFLHRQCLLDSLSAVQDRIRGRLLDLGCNDRPYERFFGNRSDAWLGLDRPWYNGGPTEANVVGDALELPFKSESFDTVLCTQVLGDVPRPDILFAESFRVLRLGGHLILSAPQYSALQNEPNDYYRFTHYGLRYLGEQAGFEVVQLLPVGGAAALLGRVLCSHVLLLNRNRSPSRLLSAVVQWVFYRADRRWFHPSDPMSWLIVCLKA